MQDPPPNFPRDALVLKLDLTEVGAHHAAVDAHVRRWGRLDLTLLNAGIGERPGSGPVGGGGGGRSNADADADAFSHPFPPPDVAARLADWRRVLTLDLAATLEGIDAAARVRSSSSPGSPFPLVAVVASAGALWPMPGAPVYAAAKGGLWHLVRSLGPGLTRRSAARPRLIALCPAYARSAMVSALVGSDEGAGGDLARRAIAASGGAPLPSDALIPALRACLGLPASSEAFASATPRSGAETAAGTARGPPSGTNEAGPVQSGEGVYVGRAAPTWGGTSSSGGLPPPAAIVYAPRGLARVDARGRVHATAAAARTSDAADAVARAQRSTAVGPVRPSPSQPTDAADSDASESGALRRARAAWAALRCGPGAIGHRVVVRRLSTNWGIATEAEAFRVAALVEPTPKAWVGDRCAPLGAAAAPACPAQPMALASVASAGADLLTPWRCPRKSSRLLAEHPAFRLDPSLTRLPTRCVVVVRTWSGVNASDVNRAAGRYHTSMAAARAELARSPGLSFPAGFEASGIVVACGAAAAAAGLRPGDAVVTFGHGGFATHAAVDLSACFSLGPGAGWARGSAGPDARGAALATSGLTALLALDAPEWGGLGAWTPPGKGMAVPRPGEVDNIEGFIPGAHHYAPAPLILSPTPRQTALPSSAPLVAVTAAAGGAGGLAVQVARSRGAVVVAVAGGVEKCNQIIACPRRGAHAAVNYRPLRDYARGDDAALARSLDRALRTAAKIARGVAAGRVDPSSPERVVSTVAGPSTSSSNPLRPYALTAAPPGPVDVAFESVGGPFLAGCVSALAIGGRCLVIGAMEQYTRANDGNTDGDRRSSKEGSGSATAAPGGWEPSALPPGAPDLLLARSASLVGFFLLHQGPRVRPAFAALANACRAGALDPATDAGSAALRRDDVRWGGGWGAEGLGGVVSAAVARLGGGQSAGKVAARVHAGEPEPGEGGGGGKGSKL